MHFEDPVLKEAIYRNLRFGRISGNPGRQDIFLVD